MDNGPVLTMHSLHLHYEPGNKVLSTLPVLTKEEKTVMFGIIKQLCEESEIKERREE